MKLIAILTIAGLSVTGLFAGGTALNVEAENYSIDSVHSSAMFRIKHLNVSYFYGRFNDIQGTFVFDADNDSANQVEVTIKADSVDTGNANRDKHLRGPDFFNVKQFPTITFKSKSFKKEGTDKYKVTGDLTMHGVTKEISVDVTHVGTAESERSGKRCGFETVFELKRSDYGIDYMPGGLGEDVRLFISLEGVKK